MAEDRSAASEKHKDVVQCQKCGKSVPKLDGFPPWCECGWNLFPNVDNVEGYLQESYEALGKQRNQAIFDSLKDGDGFRTSFTLLRCGLNVLCACVMAASMFTLLSAIAILYYFTFNIFTLVAASVLLALTFVVSPRLERPPYEIISDRECPQLWRLISDVSAEIGVSPPEALVIDGRFAVGARRYGLSQNRYLSIGLPLLMVLDKQERVALMLPRPASILQTEVPFE